MKHVAWVAGILCLLTAVTGCEEPPPPADPRAANAMESDVQLGEVLEAAGLNKGLDRVTRRWWYDNLDTNVLAIWAQGDCRTLRSLAADSPGAAPLRAETHVPFSPMLFQFEERLGASISAHIVGFGEVRLDDLDQAASSVLASSGDTCDLVLVNYGAWPPVRS